MEYLLGIFVTLSAVGAISLTVWVIGAWEKMQQDMRGLGAAIGGAERDIRRIKGGLDGHHNKLDMLVQNKGLKWKQIRSDGPQYILEHID